MDTENEMTFDEGMERVNKILAVKEYVFDEPVQIADKTYEKVPLNWGKIKTSTLNNMQGGKGIGEYSRKDLITVACIATGLNKFEFDELPLDDGIALMGFAEVFLLNGQAKITQRYTKR